MRTRAELLKALSQEIRAGYLGLSKKGSLRFDPRVFAEYADAPRAGAALALVREVRLCPREGVWTSRSECPYCRKVHIHGGGYGPLPYFGSRDPHCLGEVSRPNRGYELVIERGRQK